MNDPNDVVLSFAVAEEVEVLSAFEVSAGLLAALVEKENPVEAGESVALSAEDWPKLNPVEAPVEAEAGAVESVLLLSPKEKPTAVGLVSSVALLGETPKEKPTSLVVELSSVVVLSLSLSSAVDLALVGVLSVAVVPKPKLVGVDDSLDLSPP